jgi:amino acid transporter
MEVFLASGGVAYTREFYAALGFVGFGVLLLIFFAYLFFRKPKNKFK